MNSWKVILATMVIFGTGVVTGGLMVRHTERGRVNRPQANQPGLRRDQATSSGFRVDFLRRVERDLDLTAEQREHIDHILKLSQDRTHKIMEPVFPLIRQELESTKAAFREQLTPAQRARFDELLKQQNQRRDPKQPPPPRDRPPENQPRPDALPAK